MKKLGIVGIVAAAAAAGIGYLMSTERGRGLMQQGREKLREGYGSVTDYVSQMRQGGGSQVEEVVQEALAEPHPDTSMARALEEAVT